MALARDHRRGGDYRADHCFALTKKWPGGTCRRAKKKKTRSEAGAMPGSKSLRRVRETESEIYQCECACGLLASITRGACRRAENKKNEKKRLLASITRGACRRAKKKRKKKAEAKRAQCQDQKARGELLSPEVAKGNKKG